MINRSPHLLVIVAMLSGCYAATEDPEASEIAAALEEESGGIAMDDEAPAFGSPSSFEEGDLLDGDEGAADPMEADPEVRRIREVPDAVRVRVALEWGQIPGNRDNEEPRDWSGVLAVNRGAIVARRAMRFEPVTDRLLPRRDPQRLAFTSATLPHHDGLVVEIIDPTPEAEEPLTLTYVADLPGPLGSEGGALRVPVRALIDNPRELAADEAGNRMVAVAHARPIDVCAHGFLMGRWHRVEDGRGRFLGRVVSEDGELRGHVRGIYGQRESGEQVFFGKYINAEGEFQGLFRGNYADGSFEGRWAVREGERGALRGHYREQIPGPETGGHFIGRWAETTCNTRR